MRVPSPQSLTLLAADRLARLRNGALFGGSVMFGAALGLAGSLLIAGEAGAQDAGALESGVQEEVPEAAVPGTGDSLAPETAAIVSPAATLAGGWAPVVARVADSVVSLKLAQLRNFDDVEQGNSTATGFVVDAERGIVLTNRHVVSSGPIRISATFQNQEQIEAVPLYRDPVHDFAFIQYDPAELDYAAPDSLVLRADKVRTGMDIRVIGSDGGEQLSILPGTIARLDREVPSYGRYGYNDFNTFYLQAASGTSGGSSGSPVIDADGDVVALNAAANSRTASSFFLPLPRIQHALERLQAGEQIPRGGLQTLFVYRPFHELARRGLSEAQEQRLRAVRAGLTGLLMVQQVIPGGVADSLLEAGDILLSVDGEPVTDFIVLEALLDDRIGRTLPVEIVRQGEAQTLQVAVADLHALAPSRFVELGDAVLQDMSIQHARAMNLPQRGVVVASSGYLFDRAQVPAGAVIDQVDGQPIEALDDFVAAVSATPQGEAMMLGYVVPGREFSREVARLEVDERWFGFRACERVDAARFWDCEPVDLDRAAPLDGAPAVLVPSYRDPLLDRVAPGMVRVDFHIPYPSDNVYARHFKGVGLVVDSVEGLVAVDRNTVPIGLGDATITFFGAQEVTGSVVFLHPRHNIALLQFDPTELGAANYEALELAGHDEAVPDELTMVGYRADGTFRKHSIDELSRLTIGFDAPGLPRFQQAPLDVYGVPNVPPSLGGPIVDADGRVHGVYMSFAFEQERKIEQREFAMPAYVVAEALAQYRADSPWQSLDVRLRYEPLALARERGLPDEWLSRYLALDAQARRVLYIEQVVPATQAAERLRAGDILLAIDGTLVSDLFLAERLSQADSVVLSILRAGSVQDVTVEPSPIDALGTRRLVSWGGALFQQPHGDIAFEKGVDFPGVYIAGTADGSPALWDGLYRNRFVTAVDGRPVESLDDLLALVRAKEQDEITRLSTVTMSGRRGIIAVEPEYHFWPTFEIVRGEDGWQRNEIVD